MKLKQLQKIVFLLVVLFVCLYSCGKQVSESLAPDDRCFYGAEENLENSIRNYTFEELKENVHDTLLQLSIEHCFSGGEKEFRNHFNACAGSVEVELKSSGRFFYDIVIDTTGCISEIRVINSPDITFTNELFRIMMEEKIQYEVYFNDAGEKEMYFLRMTKYFDIY